MYTITENIQTQGDFAVLTNETGAAGLVELVKPAIDIRPAYDALANGSSGKVYVHGKKGTQRDPIYEVEAQIMMGGLRFRLTSLHSEGLELHKRLEQLVRPK